MQGLALGLKVEGGASKGKTACMLGPPLLQDQQRSTWQASLHVGRSGAAPGSDMTQLCAAGEHGLPEPAASHRVGGGACGEVEQGHLPPQPLP